MVHRLYCVLLRITDVIIYVFFWGPLLSFCPVSLWRFPSTLCLYFLYACILLPLVHFYPRPPNATHGMQCDRQNPYSPQEGIGLLAFLDFPRLGFFSSRDIQEGIRSKRPIGVGVLFAVSRVTFPVLCFVFKPRHLA